MKSDLRDYDTLDKSNFVDYEKASKFASENNATGFIECSSLTQNKLKEAYEIAIRAGLHKDKKGNKAKNCKIL